MTGILVTQAEIVIAVPACCGNTISPQTPPLPKRPLIFVTFITHRRWILPEPARAIVLETCLYADGKRCDLHGLVVMPDHVHLVLTLLADENGPLSLAEIMQGIKSTSAHRINKVLGRRGRVWQEESFDRVIRREESVGERVDYILGNPVRAGLASLPWEYPWLWPRLGQPVDHP